MRFSDIKRREKIRTGTFFAFLILLCCVFYTRWQAAEEKSRSQAEVYAMRAEGQLSESAGMVSAAISVYRSGGDAKTAEAELLRAGITGKQAVSYLSLEPAAARTLQLFFSDAEQAFCNGGETATLDALEAYAASLNRYLYRVRDMIPPSDRTDYSGIPFYPEKSDAVEAEKKADLPDSVLIGRKAALAEARKHLGGHISLREAQTNDPMVYTFYCRNACVVLRKTDGRLLRLTVEHRSGAARKTAEETEKTAMDFLTQNEYDGYVRRTVQVRDNVCYLQFEAEQAGQPRVTVGVALNTGTVCAFIAAS